MNNSLKKMIGAGSSIGGLHLSQYKTVLDESVLF